jgi:hypothetical protein
MGYTGSGVDGDDDGKTRENRTRGEFENREQGTMMQRWVEETAETRGS